MNMPSERACISTCMHKNSLQLIHKGLVESPLHIPLECVGAGVPWHFLCPNTKNASKNTNCDNAFVEIERCLRKRISRSI